VFYALCSVLNGLKAPLIGAINDIAVRAVKDQLDLSNQRAGDQESTGNNQEGHLHSKSRKLLIRDSGMVKIVPFDDIDWIDAAGDYMCIHALGETHIMRSTLLDLLKKLDDKQFVRIHRSTVVNIARVVSTSLSQKRGSLLHLPDGQTLKVSRNYRESTRKFFQ
jgi:two-component system LytT family response regulator